MNKASDARQQAGANLGRLFTEHGPGLLARLVDKQGATRSEAEDALQEVFLQLLKRINRGKPLEIESPKHYLYKAVHTSWVSHRTRKAREELQGDLPDFLNDPIRSSYLPLHPDADAVGVMHVKQLIEDLPHRQRQVIVKKIQGYGVNEIADALDLAPDTVSSHLRHARAKLTKSLSDFD